MAMFFMFGKYSAAAVKGMSARRTKSAEAIIKKYGGKIQGMYALLGDKDLAFILSFPGVDQAMKASVALSKMTGISFATYPAITVEQFDKLMAKD